MLRSDRGDPSAAHVAMHVSDATVVLRSFALHRHGEVSPVKYSKFLEPGARRGL